MKTIRTHRPRQQLRAWRKDVRRVFSLNHLRVMADSADSGPARTGSSSPAGILTSARNVFAGVPDSRTETRPTNASQEPSSPRPSSMLDAKRLSPAPITSADCGADARPLPLQLSRTAESQSPLQLSADATGEPIVVSCPAPPSRLFLKLAMSASWFVGRRLLETYSDYISNAVWPARLSEWSSFESVEMSLHPTLSLDDLAVIIESEKKSSANDYFGPPSTPWLSCFHKAAKMIGLTERQLSTEIMAYAPSKQYKYDYGSGAIRCLIANEDWCALANRLGCDHQLIDFAFPHEPATARSLREAILKLKREHFHVIRVSEGLVDSYVDRYGSDSGSYSESNGERNGEGGSDGKGNGEAKIKDDDKSGEGILTSTYPSTWL